MKLDNTKTGPNLAKNQSPTAKNPFYTTLFDQRVAFNHVFTNILREKTCMALTEAIMPHYPDFRSYREYFNRYTLLENALIDLTIPVTIIASEDDPIVPVTDLHELQKNKYLHISIQKYGGHCGFIDFLPFACWSEREISNILLQERTLNDRSGF